MDGVCAVNGVSSRFSACHWQRHHVSAAVSIPHAVVLRLSLLSMCPFLVPAGVDVDKHFRTLLCDKDPGVMGAALCALQDLAAANPAAYRWAPHHRWGPSLLAPALFLLFQPLYLSQVQTLA
jgi:hypothetical protein